MAGPIQLTEVDFDQIKHNLVNYLKSTGNFTDYDFSGSNLQVILNLISYQAQLNSYTANMVANESFLASSTIRKNVVSNARSLGYVPTSARCSTIDSDFEFKLDASNYPQGFPQFIQLNPGMVFTTATGGGSFIYNLVDVEVSAVSGNGNVTFNNIKAYEGIYLNAEFVRDESKYNQRFVLENKNIDSTTIRVRVQEEPAENITFYYYEVNNLVALTKESRNYWLEEVDNGYYELTFGDGYFGKKLKDGAKIYVDYLVTNGEMANGIQGESNFKFNGRPIDSFGTTIIGKPLILSVSKSEGGAKIEDISSIKFRAPREYASQERCVIVDDYETIIRRIFPPVDDIYVYGGETLDIPEYGRVYVAIKPTSGSVLSNITKNYIKKSLDSFRIASLDIVIVDPEVLNIEVNSSVYFDETKTLKDPSTITSDVNTSLSRYVESTSVPKFGGSIRYSKIIGTIDDAEGAITRNNTHLVMRKDFRIVPNAPATYEVCFDQKIEVDKDISTVYSSGFYLELNGSSDPRVFYMENDPKTIRFTDLSQIEQESDIYCFYFNEFNEKVIVSFYKNKFNQLVVVDQLGDDISPTPFGNVNFATGEIEIAYSFKNGIVFINTAESSNTIEVRAIPENQDIFAKDSVFMNLDVAKSNIVSLIDTQVAK